MRWLLSRGMAPDLPSIGTEGEAQGGLMLLLPNQSKPAVQGSWLLLRLGAELHTLTAEWLGKPLGELQITCLEPGVHSVQVSGPGHSEGGRVSATALNMAVITCARPWHRPFDLAPTLAGRGAAAVLSAFGGYCGRWYDGPLAYVQALSADAGQTLVSDYIPAGGAAALAFSLPQQQQVSGRPWREIQALEGSPGQRIHRCLLGRMQCALDLLAKAEPKDRICAVGDWSPTTAAELVLACQALGGPALTVTFAPALAPPPPPWRRLCQNLGVYLKPGAPGRADFQLPGLAPLADPTQLAPLLAAINSISDLLPKSLK